MRIVRIVALAFVLASLCASSFAGPYFFKIVVNQANATDTIPRSEVAKIFLKQKTR